MTVINFTITKPLEKKVNNAIKRVGFSSKAEFFRFATLNYLQCIDKDITEAELESEIDTLEDTITNNIDIDSLPSGEEQLKKLLV